MDDRTTKRSAKSSTPYDGAHEAPLRLVLRPGRAPARLTFTGALFLCWISALFQAEAFTVRLAFTAFLLVVAAVVFLTIYLGVGDRWFRGEAGGILVLQPDGLLELRQRDRDPVPGKIGTHSWVGRWFCVFVFRERGGRRSRRLIAWRADQEREHYRRLRCWLLHRFAGQGDAESVRAERRLVDFTRRIARVRRS